MATFRFSRRAEADLRSIAEYTLRTWGQHQTALYLHELEACCKKLAGHPALGRPCSEIRPELHRLEHGKHVIFYRREGRAYLSLVSFTSACSLSDIRSTTARRNLSPSNPQLRDRGQQTGENHFPILRQRDTPERWRTPVATREGSLQVHESAGPFREPRPEASHTSRFRTHHRRFL